MKQCRHSFTVYLVGFNNSPADKVVIFQMKPGVSWPSRDACLVEMLESEILELLHVPWVLHCTNVLS